MANGDVDTNHVLISLIQDGVCCKRDEKLMFRELMNKLWINYFIFDYTFYILMLKIKNVQNQKHAPASTCYAVLSGST